MFKIEKWDWWRFQIVLCSSDPDSDYNTKTRLEIQVWKYFIVIPLFFNLAPHKEWVNTRGYDWSQPEGGYWKTHGREFGISYSNQLLSVRYGAQTHDSSTTKCLLWSPPWLNHWLVNEVKLTEPERFTVKDFDGELVGCTARLEYRKWRRGRKKGSIFSYITFPMHTWHLELEFDSEVGNRKGSWKGGTLGSWSQAQKGDTNLSALIRYCDREKMEVQL